MTSSNSTICAELAWRDAAMNGMSTVWSVSG
jgi:hypothetical protein